MSENTETLGPAVTESFPQAVGLHELLSAERRANVPPSPTSPPAPTPPPAPEVPAVEFSPALFLNALKLIDKVASRALKIEPEPDEIVSDVAGAIAPLVQFYAKGSSTVAALWGNLVGALLGIGYAKYEKIQARKRLTGEPDAPTDETPAKPEGQDGSA